MEWPGRHLSVVSIFDFFFTQTRFAAMYSEVLGSEEALRTRKKKVHILTQFFFGAVDWLQRCRKWPLYDFFFFFSPLCPPFGHFSPFFGLRTTLSSTACSSVPGWSFYSSQRKHRVSYHFFNRFEQTDITISTAKRRSWDCPYSGWFVRTLAALERELKRVRRSQHWPLRVSFGHFRSWFWTEMVLFGRVPRLQKAKKNSKTLENTQKCPKKNAKKNTFHDEYLGRCLTGVEQNLTVFWPFFYRFLTVFEGLQMLKNAKKCSKILKNVPKCPKYTQ